MKVSYLLNELKKEIKRSNEDLTIDVYRNRLSSQSN